MMLNKPSAVKWIKGTYGRPKNFKLIDELSAITLTLVLRRTGDADKDGLDDVLISGKYAYNEKGTLQST